MHCPLCGGHMAVRHVDVDETWKGRTITFRGIAAQICGTCGNKVYEATDVAMMEALIESTLNKPVYPEIMDVEEVSRLLRVTPQTIYNMLRDGRLKAAKVGREWRFSREEVMERLAAYKVKEAGLQPGNGAGRTYTYGDYLTWNDEERWELIDGVPYNMTPAPNRSHQKISGELFKQIAVYLTGKTCEVYAAPFDVRLPEGDEADEFIRTVVQPDIVVYCDPRKLDERGAKGPPDLAIEILSPYTAAKDMRIKMALYERVGVKEYWLIDPGNKTLQVFSRFTSEERFGRPETYTTGDQVKVGILENLVVDLGMVFG